MIRTVCTLVATLLLALLLASCGDDGAGAIDEDVRLSPEEIATAEAREEPVGGRLSSPCAS